MKRTLPFGKWLFCLFAVSFLFLSSLSAQNQDDIKISFDASANNVENSFLKAKLDARSSKISTGLRGVISDFEAGDDMEDDKNMMVRDGKILVRVVANSPAEAETLLADLTSMGMTKGVSYQRVINGLMDIMKLEEASKLDGLRWIHYVETPTHNVGSVTSQGVEAMGIPLLPENRRFQGGGVKVGVLSDAFNSQGGADAGIASGDLPGPGNPFGRTKPVEVIEDDLDPFNIDEGRAMLEIVHDVAPKSDLAFATAFFGEAGFANNVRRLRFEAECDVIVDDIGYLAAPVYQDGLVAQAVDEVTADGAKYFSSAGNSANASYESPLILDGFFADFGFGLIYELHNFTASSGGTPTGGIDDYLQEIQIGPFGNILTSLWWDEPYFSISGAPGATSDLDYIIFDENLFPIAGSASFNIGRDPVEVFGFTNFSFDTETVFIMIGRFFLAPGVPNTIKYSFHRQSGIVSIEHADQINGGTCFGHSNAKGAMAVGAARFDQTPPFGVSPAVPEDFSSFGGIPILFDLDGNRLATPEDRRKPDFVGPDGASTSFFNAGPDFDNDGFPNFFGTSASAPHLAGVAAITQEVLEKRLATVPTNEEIRELFIQASEDMETPGYDTRTGAGYVLFSNILGILDAQIAALPAMPKGLLAVFGLIIVTVVVGRFLKF